MKVKAILDNELLDGIEIKKGEITEVDDLLGDYLIRAYCNHRIKIEDDEEAEVETEEIEETEEDDEEEVKVKSTRKKK